MTDPLIRALTHRGNSWRHAWLMARAGYVYTRGYQFPDGKCIGVSEAMRHAWDLFWEYAPVAKRNV